jgi:ribosomal-protein-alanine N-acetyltransferase
VKPHYQTDRLELDKLSYADIAFFLDLVNSPEWLKYIGDRNIHTQKDSRAQIKKIKENFNANYWVVRLKDHRIPIGIITFIKRSYLDHYDIGFAFLSKYGKKGYAFEATTAVLRDVLIDHTHTQILAITTSANENSIRLIEKIGLKFWKEIQVENDPLLLYSAQAADLVNITSTKVSVRFKT